MAWLPSARAQRDEVLRPEIHRVHQASLDGCYGAKKIWKQLQREGITVANCTVRRLMQQEGITGVRRGRQFKITTIADENQLRPNDLADLTYVKTHTGWTYVAFIIDVFSRSIVEPFLATWDVTHLSALSGEADKARTELMAFVDTVRLNVARVLNRKVTTPLRHLAVVSGLAAGPDGGVAPRKGPCSVFYSSQNLARGKSFPRSCSKQAKNDGYLYGE